MINGIYITELLPRELILHRLLESACADPESFVRGGPTLATFFSLMRIQNTTLNGVSLSCR